MTHKCLRALSYRCNSSLHKISRSKCLLIAFAYGFAAASMAFINKAILNTYQYDYPLFIVTTQMVVTVVLLEIFRLAKLINIDPYTIDRGKTLLIPSILYAVNSVIGLVALSDMNIPMFGMMKRCAPVVVLVLGVIVLGNGMPHFMISFSVMVITLGCIIAGYGDLAFDLKTYVYGLISVLFQGLYLVFVQYSAQTLSVMDTLYVNSLNSMPILLLVSMVSGDTYTALSNFDYHNTGFMVIFTLVILMGCALNYLLILCTSYNSALTTSITSTLKSILQTVVGMFTFGGISLNVYTISGICINLVGGVLYTVAKYWETQHFKTRSVIVKPVYKI